jgi:hypothetical protein
LSLREKVVAACNANPHLSNRQIAELVKCGQTVVQNYRKEAGIEREASGGVPKEKAEIIVDGNQTTGEVVSSNPLSLEEFVALFKIDESIWKVDKFECTSWDVGMKMGAQAVAYVKVTRLYRTMAKFIRHVPIEPSMPEVRPIVINFKASSKALPRRMRDSNLKRAIIWPDIQTGYRREYRTGYLDPFHDRKALDLALQITKHVQPDVVVHLGDNLDLPDFSDKFVKSAEFYFTAQPAAIEYGWWLAQLRAIDADMPIHWIEGNHDKRFMLSVINHNIHAYGLRPIDDLNGPPLMSIERFMGLKSLGVTYHGPYPNGEYWINDRFGLSHGEIARAKSGATVQAVLQGAISSKGQGHTHRAEVAVRTDWKRDGARTHLAVSFGTLARIEPGIVPSNASHNNWQNCVGEAIYEEGDGLFDVRLILLHDGEAIYDGRKWKARDERETVEQIASDTGWEEFNKQRSTQ